MKSLWPDPLITPQEFLEARIKHVEVHVMNKVEPEEVLIELRFVLAAFRKLEIGGRTPAAPDRADAKYTKAKERFEEQRTRVENRLHGRRA